MGLNTGVSTTETTVTSVQKPRAAEEIDKSGEALGDLISPIAQSIRRGDVSLDKHSDSLNSLPSQFVTDPVQAFLANDVFKQIVDRVSLTQKAANDEGSGLTTEVNAETNNASIEITQAPAKQGGFFASFRRAPDPKVEGRVMISTASELDDEGVRYVRRNQVHASIPGMTMSMSTEGKGETIEKRKAIVTSIKGDDQIIWDFQTGMRTNGRMEGKPSARKFNAISTAPITKDNLPEI